MQNLILPSHSTTIRSPAKINLYLHITGRRDDGYHDLDSLVCFTDFGDEITITKSANSIFSKSGPFAHDIPDDESNSLKKAWRGLELYMGHDLPCHVHIQKNIPSGAGLGGGSSNAAALLHGLIDHFSLSIDYNDILDMAASIGSDVPVCLHQSPMMMRGRGEVCNAGPSFPTTPILLIKPNTSHPTAEIYKLLSMQNYSSQLSPPDYFDTTDELISWLKNNTKNDLETPAFQMSPELPEIMSFVSKQKDCLLVRMTGSGF